MLSHLGEKDILLFPVRALCCHILMRKKIASTIFYYLKTFRAVDTHYADTSSQIGATYCRADL